MPLVARLACGRTDRRWTTWPATAPITFAPLVVACALPLWGCRAPAPPTGPTTAVVHVADYDAFVDSTLSVLRRYDFPPERVDRLHGQIVSTPTTGGQWFEWWREDSRGGYQLLESSLHTIRRVVTVDIEPLDTPADAAPTTSAPETDVATPGAYRVRVQVDKSRYSAPERQITTTSGALRIYSAAVPTAEGRRAPRRPLWTPLGRDALLEEWLLTKITGSTPEPVVANATEAETGE